MRSIRTENKYPNQELKLGVFSKKEAAQAISSGVQHVHSSKLRETDPLVQATLARINGTILSYPWEQNANPKQFLFKSSKAQEQVNDELIANTKLFRGSSNRDRLKIVLGELTTNFFYHSFKNNNGQDKYDRRTKTSLTDSEQVNLHYFENNQGICLRFSDNSGTLKFQDLASRLYPCYQMNNESSFESKHQGAGLGFYLVFETVTHLSISVVRNQQTVISVWLASLNQYQHDFFSFNYFEEERK